MDLRKLFGRGKSNFNDAIRDELHAAADWLHTSNTASARDWGLGQESRFEVDQESGRMTLFFAGGRKAILPIQIIASFLPADRSVLWAWANDSVDRALAGAATGLKNFGVAKGVALLRGERQTLSFDDLVKYAALAASLHGCEGLYRCLRDDHSTVFVGFGSPEFESKHGEKLDSGQWWPKGRSSLEFEGQAKDLVEAWDFEMFPIDRDYHRRSHRTDDARIEAMEAALDAKDRIYRTYWSAKNERWRPDSFAWPSDHDPAAWLGTLTVPRLGGGCLVVRWPSPNRTIAYVVQEKDGQPRITDIDEDWGSGLVWIGPEG